MNEDEQNRIKIIKDNNNSASNCIKIKLLVINFMVYKSNRSLKDVKTKRVHA